MDTNPFLLSFFPAAEELIPPHKTTTDLWVIGDNTQFDTQWIECSYPISGSYGPTPRYIFYVLTILAVCYRKSAWIGAAALASVMAYSATAAIHAIVLVAIRTRLIPADISNYMVILATGRSSTGLDDGLGNALWLPVLPMAWDNDGDPVLAIVGTAFLILLPMQTWSTTFKKSDSKLVLFLWSGLLFIGMISALINAAYVDLWAFPQLRFCPPGESDQIPLTNSGTNIVGSDFETSDAYYWNRTAYNYFGDKTGQQSNTCLYPCFSASWLLRDPTDITVINGNEGHIADSQAGWSLFFAVYAVISASGLSSLTIFAISIANQPPSWLASLASTFKSPILKLLQPCFTFCGRKTKGTWLSGNRVKDLVIMVWKAYVMVTDKYARILSPFALLFFVAWVEWYMWTNDPQGETFRHVGQWGSLVAAVLVTVGALVGFFSSTTKKSSTTYQDYNMINGQSF